MSRGENENVSLKKSKTHWKARHDVAKSLRKLRCIHSEGSCAAVSTVGWPGSEGEKRECGGGQGKIHCYNFCAKLEFMKRICAAEHKKEASSGFI